LDGEAIHKPHVIGQLLINSAFSHIALLVLATLQSFLFPELILNFPFVSSQMVGTFEGWVVGMNDGEIDGLLDGSSLGICDGASDGKSLGKDEGDSDGSFVGKLDGSSLGEFDGFVVGTSLGEFEGAIVHKPHILGQ